MTPSLVEEEGGLAGLLLSPHLLSGFRKILPIYACICELRIGGYFCPIKWNKCSHLPLLPVFVTLHKHCCSKGGIGVRPPCTSQRNDWRPSSLLVGRLGQVVPTLHGCPPEKTCALLPSASEGDWDHSFPMNVCKLHCYSLPSCLALTFLYFRSTPKNELGYSSTFFPSTVVGLLVLFSAPEHLGSPTPFPFPPLPAPDL